MQKVLRRAALARRQAERKAVRAKDLEKRNERAEARREAAQVQRLIGAQNRQERVARREDWLRGPLAPRRDIGHAASTYGAVEPHLTRWPKKKDPKDYGIREGDRVVIAIKGHRDEGKIGAVVTLDQDSESCRVSGLNMADVIVPEHMLTNEADKSRYRPYPLPLPLSGVRLIAKIRGRDVVINELEVTYPMKNGKEDKSGEIERHIAGLIPRIEIELPQKEEEQHNDEKPDTLRYDVENVTFTPTMRVPPMPPSVIDELRNKYSKFRVRHDPEYIRKKESEDWDAKEKEALLKLKMLTPLQELRSKRKREREAIAEPELSNDMLARIGEVMERNKDKIPVQRRPRRQVGSPTPVKDTTLYE